LSVLEEEKVNSLAPIFWATVTYLESFETTKDGEKTSAMTSSSLKS
jgi:hypothetical protein